MKRYITFFILLFISFNLFGNSFEYLRDLSYSEYLELNDPELKLRAYLMHFEPIEKFKGGSTDDLEGWDLEILKEDRNILPSIRKLVDEFEIIPNRYINTIGYELYSLLFFLRDFFDSGVLLEEEIDWFICKYQEKVENYLITYREVNIDLGNFDYFIEYFKVPETDFKKLYGDSYKSKMRYIYIKYSELGFQNLYIDQEDLKFTGYHEVVNKYNPVITK